MTDTADTSGQDSLPSGPEPAEQPDNPRSGPEPAEQQDNTQSEEQPARPSTRAKPLDQVTEPPKEPHMRDIVASYRGTGAEWLLSRIIGWHDRITPDREKDIDNILYLLKQCKYLPEEPEHAPFVALIALVWARLPITPDLQKLPDVLTGDQIDQRLRKTAQELQWVGKPEFNAIQVQLNRYFENDVGPKLAQFDASIDKIIKRLNERSAAGVELDGLDAKIDAIIKRLNDKSATGVELDTGKMAEAISERVITTGKKQFEGIYLWMLGMMAFVFFICGMAVMYLAQHLSGK